MKQIIAIGGGEMRHADTFLIDSYVVQLARENIAEDRKPVALFLPTASFESKPYCNTFYKTYGTKLKCQPKTILLDGGEMDDEEIARRFLMADIIYIGGGNYLRLRAKVLERGLDKLLKEAYLQGKILVGVSAGAMLFFEKALSDCRLEETGKYIVVEGLGLLEGFFCPHFEIEDRKKAFMNVAKDKKVFVAESNTALHFVDGEVEHKII